MDSRRCIDREEKGEKQTMKTCVVTSPLHYEIREMPIPEPKDCEVQIKMMAAGVCGSDIHIFKGENPNSRYPLIPGHENVGVVTKTGKDCSRIHVGDHVVIDYVMRCGECYQCTHQRGNVCEHVLVRGSGTDGGWRQYWCVEEEYVYPISSDISWEDAALIEPLTIGEHCTKRGRVCEDDTVLVLGSGTIGTIIAQACKLKGAKTVICCDVNESSLERSRAFGADEIIHTQKQDLVEEVRRITNGHGCTVAFDAACFPGSLTMLMQPGIVCNAGRVVPLGFCTEPEKITQQMINGRELEIIGTRMSLDQWIPTARNLADGKYRMEGLATTLIPFSKVEKVFQNIVNPDPDVKKMVILFDEE